MGNPVRGLVVAKQGREVIVLTPEGEWRSIPLAGPVPEVGEEVMLPPAKKASRRQVLMAAAAVILLLVLALPLARRAIVPSVPVVPAYYVGIDINPSIELAVDGEERVLSARGFNEDGEKLLGAVALKNEKIAEAVAILTTEAIRQGYYLPDRKGTMVVTVSPAEGRAEEEREAGDALGQKVSERARNILRQAGVEAVVETAVVDPEIRSRAEAYGLSPGKYGILLEALEAGLPVTADDLKQESIAGVLGRFGDNWEELLHRLHQDRELLQKERQLDAALKKALGKKEANENSPDTATSGKDNASGKVGRDGNLKDKSRETGENASRGRLQENDGVAKETAPERLKDDTVKRDAGPETKKATPINPPRDNKQSRSHVDSR
ncbi:anti-sigma factor domain-containing protein [Neomoorella humiferrea]|uniref:anti-sigma factor domain-containing protein n=1 Tax=Neomoorella humiferrea TaxID=676965 RepID=UPI003D8B3869